MIYFKAHERVFHMAMASEEITAERKNIIEPNNFLQLATMKLNKGKTFRAHQHKWHVEEMPQAKIAQESWVVIKGKVRAFYYDLDGKLLGTFDLQPGDVSITLEGGHNYEILEDNTLIYEFKTGPYIDQEHDKEFLDEKK